MLKKMMEQCEIDTREIIDDYAAELLGKWREHYIENGEQGVVEFVRSVLNNNSSEKNGRKINEKKGVSLEYIVIEHCSELFTENDIERAEVNLGLREKKPPHRLFYVVIFGVSVYIIAHMMNAIDFMWFVDRTET